MGGDPTHIARIDPTATDAPASPLYAAIARRHADRGAYATRSVATSRLDELGALVDAPGAELVWFTSDPAKTAFGDLTLRATRAIIADRQQSADDYAWYRSGWDEIQSKKDGITIDPSGQTPLIRALSKLVPVTQEQNNDGWLKGMRTIQIPTAAAFGAIVVRDPGERGGRIAAGRHQHRDGGDAAQRDPSAHDVPYRVPDGYRTAQPSAPGARRRCGLTRPENERAQQ